MVLDRLSILGAGVAFAGVVAACGPSFQVVYEGDARFEHCYALDDTPTISMQEKSDCWTQWMRSYTYGQTRNRVDYAAMRAKALRELHAAPTDEAVMGAAPGEGAADTRGHDLPAPTSAFAPPPETVSTLDAGKSTTPTGVVGPGAEIDVVKLAPPTVPGSDAVPAATPGERCTGRCRSSWQRCRPGCKGTACGGCDGKYAGCMRRCFQ